MYLLDITVSAFETASMRLQNMHASQSPRNNNRYEATSNFLQNRLTQDIYIYIYKHTHTSNLTPNTKGYTYHSTDTCITWKV